MAKCPDDGTCHHNCTTDCYRVACCGPLSGVYPNDVWPEYLTKPVENARANARAKAEADWEKWLRGRFPTLSDSQIISHRSSVEFNSYVSGYMSALGWPE